MKLEEIVLQAFKTIPRDEFGFLTAYARNELALVKRLSWYIQQEVQDECVVRNEYSNPAVQIKKGDIVVITKKGGNQLQGYLEAKWLFSHHLVDDNPWYYKKQPSHNHHYSLKEDFKKLMSAKMSQGERLFLLLITHPHTVDLPEYWADSTVHSSLELPEIKKLITKRLHIVLNSPVGLDSFLLNIHVKPTITIHELTLNTPDEIPISLLYSLINLDKILLKTR